MVDAALSEATEANAEVIGEASGRLGRDEVRGPKNAFPGDVFLMARSVQQFLGSTAAPLQTFDG